MAINYGYDGSLLLGSTGTTTAAKSVAHVTKWNLSVETDALEITDFGDKDRTYVPGLRNVSATFEAYFADTDTGQYAVKSRITAATPSKVQAILRYYSTTGAKAGWKGSGVLTNAAIDVPNDGIQTMSGTIQFAGGVSVYTS